MRVQSLMQLVIPGIGIKFCLARDIRSFCGVETESRRLDEIGMDIGSSSKFDKKQNPNRLDF